MRLLMTLAFLSLALGLLHAEELVIDDFEYADDAAAQAAFAPDQGSPPVAVMDHDGGKALRMDCPFTQDVGRSVYDRTVELNLSRFGQFTLDYYIDDPKPIGGFTLYFRSGEGWYGAGFGGEKGWNQITLLKSAFRTEDAPAGWDKVTGFRLSQWKDGEGDTFVAIDNLKAYATDIAVILATKAIAAGGSEARSVESFDKGMQELLNDAGIVSDLITDEDVIAGGLADRRVAIFPYSPVMDPQVLEATRQFVEGGGKVFLFYSLDPGMGELLGVRNTGWKARGDGDPFAVLQFDAPGVQGLPAQVGQGSWNTNVPEPTRPDAKVIGWWANGEGQRGGDAAMVLSDTGVYMGHVLTDADREGKQRMMTALLGVFVPDVWARKADRALKSVAKAGPFETVDELRAYVADYGEKPKALLSSGVQSVQEAEKALADGQAAKACELADAARAAMREAYALAHRGRTGEFRAMWEHSGTGPFPGDWGKSLDLLKANGFNAIVPNMWWAGLAYYNSEYLPVAEKVAKYGDQIEQCVQEAHQRGIEVHVWKVNWNLGNAPKEFVEKLRAEGRTMVDVKGEPVDWLCPSHPENYRLELDTMLEPVRKYDVDGIHFDYIRYLGESVCYCDGCKDRFEADTGLKVTDWPNQCYSGDLHDQYRQWRCDQITRLVRSVSEESRKLKPWVRISAAVFSNYPSTRDSIGQDWLLWVKEGYLDFVCPMDYTDNNAGFRRTVARQVAQVNGRVPLYPGIGASAPGQPSDMTITQVEIARELGADGFTVFQFDGAKAIDHVPAMGQALLKPATYTPNGAPKIVFDLPGEPTEEDALIHLPKGAPVGIALHVDNWGTHAQDVKGTRVSVELQKTDGSTVEEFPLAGGRLPEKPKVTVKPREGRLRIAVLGELTFADGSKRPFIVRSTPFAFDR